MGFQLQHGTSPNAVTRSLSIKKVPISRNVSKKKRADVSRNEELVFCTFLKLEQELGKRPTQIQVAAEIGLSRKKVGQYFKKLGL